MARADTPERREKRQRFLNELMSVIPVYPVTAPIALRAGQIDGQSQSRGIRISLSDLLIGVTALELGYRIATDNVRHFQSIPGLQIIKLQFHFALNLRQLSILLLQTCVRRTSASHLLQVSVTFPMNCRHLPIHLPFAPCQRLLSCRPHRSYVHPITQMMATGTEGNHTVATRTVPVL